MMTTLSVRDMKFSTSNDDKLVANFSIPPDRLWTSVIGESGVGKTTLIRNLLGFVAGSSGQVVYQGQLVSTLKARHELFAYMAQDSTLFGHLDVESNLMLGLHSLDVSRAEKHLQIVQMMARFQLSSDLLGRSISSISGGQLARVNLVRTLLLSRPFMVLDEPFSSLDDKLRVNAIATVRSLAAQESKRVICVTHHQDDVALFADQFLFLSKNGAEVFPSSDLGRAAHESLAFARFWKESLVAEVNGSRICLHPGSVRAMGPSPVLQPGATLLRWRKIPEYYRNHRSTATIVVFPDSFANAAIDGHSQQHIVLTVNGNWDGRSDLVLCI
jgi:ABC-type nitrate/sulfonate/bicarbonate transport system ATPase subunit